MPSLLDRVQNRTERARFLRGIESLSTVPSAYPDYHDLLQQVRISGTDSVEYFGNGFTHEGDFCLQQNPEEFAALTAWLASHGPYSTYLEIGSASGGACLFLSQHVTIDRLLSIDDGNHPRATEQDRLLGQVNNLTRCLTDSHLPAARTFLTDQLGDTKLDVAFIDGDHTYEGVMQDIELTLPFCRPGTVVVLHDIVACEDVRRAWRESLRRRWLDARAEFVGAGYRPLGIAIGTVR